MTDPKHLDSYTGVSDSNSLNSFAYGNCCKMLQVTTHASRIRVFVYSAANLPLTHLAAYQTGSDNRHSNIRSNYRVMSSYQVHRTGAV